MMRYEELDCGIRVITPRGTGVVRSYDAKTPALRNLFGGLSRRSRPVRAQVVLDTGTTVNLPISKLKKLEGKRRG